MQSAYSIFSLHQLYSQDGLTLHIHAVLSILYKKGREFDESKVIYCYEVYDDALIIHRCNNPPISRITASAFTAYSLVLTMSQSLERRTHFCIHIITAFYEAIFWFYITSA